MKIKIVIMVMCLLFLINSANAKIIETNGAVTYVNGNTVITFLQDGYLTTNTSIINAEYLIVGGGGGGGRGAPPGAGNAGGGGAGGYLEGVINLASGNHNITVGAGGITNNSNISWTNGGNGGSSVIDNITSLIAYGGGGGGRSHTSACSGGSSGGSGGGGGWRSCAGAHGVFWDAQGNRGGDSSSVSSGGGGGGAGWPGSYNGGGGKISNISGTPTYYAGGGAGAGNHQGGIGGGGSTAAGVGENGTSGLGGGGGGCDGINPAGFGGSGVVIIKLTGIYNQSTSHISGQVIAQDGEPVQYLNITLREFEFIGSGAEVDHTFTDSNGTYDFYAPPNGLYSITVTGYCSEVCTTFTIEDVVQTNNADIIIPDYTWPLKLKNRVQLVTESGASIPNALISLKNLPNSGNKYWMSTSSDGWSNYENMQASKIYFDYYGVDADISQTPLYSISFIPVAYYVYTDVIITIPNDLSNDTNVTVNPQEDNDFRNMISDGEFLVTVLDEAGNSISNANVKITANDKSYTGQIVLYTNASGQVSFDRNYTVGSYDIAVSKRCYLPQSKTRSMSANFILVYSCATNPPGQEDNGSGGFQNNSSNWNFNGTVATDSDVKTKLSSWMYLISFVGVFVLFITYFTRK